MASLVTPTVRSTAVALLMIAYVIGFIESHNSMVYGQSCDGFTPDITGLTSYCNKYVRKDGPSIQPSEDCCRVIRNANMHCLCKYANQNLESIISVPKAIYVAQYCGVVLQRGAKCGSKFLNFLIIYPLKLLVELIL